MGHDSMKQRHLQGACQTLLTSLACACVMAEVARGATPAPDAAAREPAAISRTTVLSCPLDKLAFDHAAIDRTLVEPRYASDKPLYRFFAFGPDGKSVMAMVLDESQGTGKGYDVYYVDLNLDRNITAADERFPCKQPLPTKPSPFKAAALSGLAQDAGGTVVPEECPMVAPEPSAAAGLARTLDIPDPMFKYLLSWEGGKWLVHTMLRSGDWHARLAMYDCGNVWSANKPRAPVYRFGGSEWDFHQDAIRGQVFKPGDDLTVETTAPFFAGSSPEIRWGQESGLYVYGGYTHARYSLESLERPGDASRVFFVGNTCCGGRHVSRILVPAMMPPGRAELVLSMDTPDSYLGRVVQRIPVTIENPDYGKPLPVLDVTAALRKEFPTDTVVELFQGADLAAWGLGEYDGVRDTYIAGYPETGEPNGAQSQGGTISYSYDCRNDLRIGSSKVCRTLLRFDLSMLPPESKVKKAMLQVRATSINEQADRTTRVRLLRKPWNEDLSNGKAAMGDQGMEWFSAWYRGMPFPVGEEVRWEKPYATGVSDRVEEPAGTIGFAAVGWDGLDLTAAVQQWVAGPAANHGVVMEQANPPKAGGAYAVDVNIVSSDHPGFPAWRPRLVLVLEQGSRPVPPPAVEERDPDLAQARTRAQAEKKLLLVNVLSAKSLTARNFQKMLNEPGVREYVAERFVEIRIDADKPEHRKVLDLYGVKYAPTTLVIRPAETPEQDAFDRFEPFRWNTRYGKGLSWFEQPGPYTLHLEYLRSKGSATLPWRRLADGSLYPLDEHVFYQRFDWNGGMRLQ